MKRLKIANRVGSVDVREPLSKRYAWIRSRQASKLCRKHRITFARALTGFRGPKSRGYRAVYWGVVVSTNNGKRLEEILRVASLRKMARILLNRATEISTEELGFVSMIRSQPDEKTNWLAYADWLRDHDNEHAAQKIVKAVHARYARGTDAK